MDTQVAHLILNSVTAVALLVWLAGLRFLVMAAREPHVDRGLDTNEPTDRLPIQGMAEVDGEPESLALLAASILAKGSVSQFGPVRIVSRTADAVIFEGSGESTGLGQCVRHGVIHFARLNQTATRIDYALEVPHGKGLLLGGAIFQILGLAAVATGFWLINAFVADAPSAAVRASRFRWFRCSISYGLHSCLVFCIVNGMEPCGKRSTRSFTISRSAIRDTEARLGGPDDDTYMTHVGEAATPRNAAILLLGPTGTGKTPLGNVLAVRGWRGLPCLHFDFGANLRELVARNQSR